MTPDGPSPGEGIPGGGAGSQATDVPPRGSAEPSTDDRGPEGGTAPPDGGTAGDQPSGDDGSGGAADADQGASEPAAPTESLADSAVPFGAMSNVVRDDVKDANILQGNQISVTGDFVVGATGRPRARGRLQLVVTAEADKAAASFVPPPMFEGLVAELDVSRTVIVSGRAGSGRRCTALQALRRHRPDNLVQLPADIATEQLLDHIVHLSRSGDVGVLVESIDARRLRAIDGFAASQLSDAAESGARVVFTCDTAQLPPGSVASIPVVVVEPPDVTRLVASALGDVTPEVRTRVAQALHAAGPIAVGVALDLARAVAAEPDVPVDQIAGRYAEGGLNEVLGRWFDHGGADRGGRPAEDIALLAAAATLDGLPLGQVHGEAHRLAGLLVPAADAVGATQGVRRWRRMTEMLPTALVAPSERVVATHFGDQPGRMLSFTDDHARRQALRFLWTEMGPGFAAPFTEWLTSLGGDMSVAADVATAVGLLFSLDPVGVEAALLRPWVTSGALLPHVTVGFALGVPVASKRNAEAARELVRAWAGSSDWRCRRCAIFAYGGTLGAWDSASAAPLNLLDIDVEARGDPRGLEGEVDWALARLVGAGAGAVRSRRAVVTLLGLMAEQPSQRRRVFDVVAEVWCLLSSDVEDAQASLSALRSPQERQSWEMLAELLGLAFTTPSGFAAADQSLDHLMRAVAAGVVNSQVIVDLIKTARARLDTAKEAHLARQIQRSLGRLRRDGDVADAANRLTATLFNEGRAA